MQIDSIQHVCDELLQEDARCDADFAAELTCDTLRELPDILVVGQRLNSIRSRTVFGIDVAHSLPDFAESLEVKGRKSDLHGARIVKARVRLKVDMQPLRQRL